MITRVLGLLSEKQIEAFFASLIKDGRQSATTLLLDEDRYVNQLSLDYKDIEHRKLALKLRKTDEEKTLLANAQSEWVGRVNGKPMRVSEKTLTAVNLHLSTYHIKRALFDKYLISADQQDDLFFGVPIARHLRDYKKFKQLLLSKTLQEPTVMKTYIDQFIDSLKDENVIYPFLKTSTLTTIIKQHNPFVYNLFGDKLEFCTVDSSSSRVISMIETLVVRSIEIDNMFDENVWRETQEILPIFHNQHLRYLCMFFSSFLFYQKHSTLPRNITGDTIRALMRKVDELCS